MGRLLESAKCFQMSQVSRFRCRNRNFLQPTGVQGAWWLHINDLTRILHCHSTHENDYDNDRRAPLTSVDHDSSV